MGAAEGISVAPPRFLTIDLFSGAGGLTQGFRAAGFSCVFANDHEKPALATFARNHPEALTTAEPIEKLDAAAIRRRLGLDVGQLDGLLGGPPCQGFSTYGRRDPEDHRNQLYLHFLRFLEEFQPRSFVLENVVGILSLEDGKIIDDLRTRARRVGYGVAVGTLDAVEFGVPQYRKRVFVLGGRDGHVLNLPEATHRLPGAPERGELTLWGPANELLPPVTVRDAISDLPAKVLVPRKTQTAMPYGPNGPYTAYQARMRTGAQLLTHHSAKQMLGIRRLRLALMRPGDYGTQIRSRLLTEGLASSLIEELLARGEGLRDLEECRTADRENERELRRVLQHGKVNLVFLARKLASKSVAMTVWCHSSETAEFMRKARQHGLSRLS